MVMNCLSEVFSFNCRRRKKKSNVFRKNKDESESDTLSNCTMVSKNEKVKKKEEDSDIIDSYSKSNESKVKIKKSIQVNKSQFGKKSKPEPESPGPISSSYSECSEDEIKNQKSRSKVNKKDLVLKDANKDKNNVKNDFNSTIEDLSNSLNKLNASRKKHQLIKLNDRVKDTKNTKKSEVEHRNLKGKYVSEEMGSPSLSQSISNDSEQRNFLSDTDVHRATRKASKVIDSDSEIWFLKNKNENLKFNHNLRMKMVEYLIKKSSK